MGPLASGLRRNLCPHSFIACSLWLRGLRQCTELFTAVKSPMQRPAAGQSFVLDQVLVASTSDEQLQHPSDGKAATQSLRSPVNTGSDVEATESDTHASLTQHANRGPSTNQTSNNSVQDHRTQEGSASPLLRAPGALATSAARTVCYYVF